MALYFRVSQIDVCERKEGTIDVLTTATSMCGRPWLTKTFEFDMSRVFTLPVAYLLI